MTGDAVPAIETDLGSVQCVRAAEGWRAYIPAAYNASSGGHEVHITVNGETITRTLTVLPKDFGTVEAEAEEPAADSANAQFRSAIWPLYEAAATAKQWQGGFVPPAEDSMTLVDYGQIKVTNGQQGSRSNSTKLYTIPGAPCAPQPTARWCLQAIWHLPATRWSSTTAAGCAATCTACRSFRSARVRPWKRGRLWARWARS